MENLNNKRVAILVTDGFEQSEFTAPKKAVENAGATVDVVSLNSGTIKSWNDGNWGEEYQVDKTLDEVSVSDYNSLILPGGVINPDLLRNNSQAVDFVKGFVEAEKPVSAICHGPWLLAEAGVLEGRKITSYSSIKTDMINAGANWVDEEVVVDSGLTTSRNPNDLPAFCDKIVEEIAEGKHEEMSESV
ncbi:type 1 glutamine amidotransferase domain-containing protein [Brumimicrobium aurantiacum]|uniref:Type 1 glutamine amidotransferase n=1 Tax=Brumimicrobium aurantiacum TaxID=1737063 RepID=A0A3E1F0W7_9FLAO|nr:type 1 glutamine amidotransferase domain-containing protein [Brumimicrobium aurantiacum]RFC55471.1 type 1 glutamine amidotransferase [Brumimicrobium aurantiacum]